MTVLIRTLLLAATLTIAGCSGETPPAMEKSQGTPEVAVAEIQPWQVSPTRALPGIVRPGKRAVLSTRIAGTLLSVDTEPGDRVETGDVLATVDARDVKAAIRAIQSNITAAESAVEQARRDVQRLQRLHDEDLIARIKVEQARVKVQQVEARLQTAKSELEAQQTNLEYTRLTAPFNGQVVETLVDAGSFVGPGRPLMVLETRDQLRIDVPVSSQVAAGLTPGQQVSVITDEDEAIMSARFISVIPALDKEATGQRLRLVLDGSHGLLAPGQVVSVLVPNPKGNPSPATHNWVALPKSGLIRRGQLTGVLVVEQRQSSPAVHLKWIKTANPPTNRTDLIPVTEGLSAGEWVVLNPSADLRDGQVVTLITAGADDGQR